MRGSLLCSKQPAQLCTRHSPAERRQAALRSGPSCGGRELPARCITPFPRLPTSGCHRSGRGGGQQVGKKGCPEGHEWPWSLLRTCRANPRTPHGMAGCGEPRREQGPPASAIPAHCPRPAPPHPAPGSPLLRELGCCPPARSPRPATPHPLETSPQQLRVPRRNQVEITLPTPWVGHGEVRAPHQWCLGAVLMSLSTAEAHAPHAEGQTFPCLNSKVKPALRSQLLTTGPPYMRAHCRDRPVSQAATWNAGTFTLLCTVSLREVHWFHRRVFSAR